MPATVYSVCFLAVSNTAAVHTLTVPSGRVWILRDVDVTAQVVTDGEGCRIQGSAGQTIWYAVWKATDVSPSLAWRGRQVLAAGQQLIVTPQGGWDITISGYDLASP